MIEKKIAGTDLDLIPEVVNRWSPRAFAEKPVEDVVLKRIFEAARWAPSSRNEQPWRFIVARKDDAHYQKVFEGLDEFNQKWAWTAPVLAVVLAKKRHEYKNRSNIYHMHDVGLAMGTLLAQATHEGLSLHQMGGISKEKLIENFGLDQEDLAVVSIVAIGYQDETRLEELEEKYRKSEYEPRKRRALKELVFGASMTENPRWLKS
jgi:nitroreductase